MDRIRTNLLSWATDPEPEVVEQAARITELPFVPTHVALMADAHLGLGGPVGAVIPTLGAIIPAAVGVDIGCGMIATQTNLNASELPDDLGILLKRVESVVPAGMGRGHEEFGTHRDLHRLGSWIAPIDDPKHSATRQLGTLGSGNHFVEISIDAATDAVWVVLHSGSRGIGNRLASYHIEQAKGIMKEMFISLPDPDLAYLVQGSLAFEDYVHDLLWAQRYAALNREKMMTAVLGQLYAVVFGMDARDAENDLDTLTHPRINCHHNYTEREHHFGQNLWITRKGAIRARVGDRGVIPGSMGTNTYIVTGLGHPGSYQSASHGAGRRMSRTKAKNTLTVESLEKAMEGRTWLNSRASSLVDEHPDAYKDIEQVMANQADLVRIDHELHAVLNYKGT